MPISQTKDIMPDGFTEMPCGCATLAIANDNKNIVVNLDGPSTKPSVIGTQTNQLKLLVTIEFKPAGLYALTGINQSELIDQSISFAAVTPKLSKLLSDTVEKAENIHELSTSLDLLLLEHMYTAFHPQLIQTLQTIVASAGTIGVKSLSENIYYSERQLNRIFTQHVGLSTKSFSRLIRINNSFHLLKNNLVGEVEIITSDDVKHEMWYEGLGHHFTGPDEPNYCVLKFTTKRYKLFLDYQDVAGTL